MRVRAFAKINLSLRVLGTRRDGFHELRTIFQSIALHDELTIHRTRGPFILTSDDPACVADETNLIWRAAARTWEAADRPGALRGVAIHLAKRIPMQAGLGGGSSDAAATIRALGNAWRVPADEQRRIGTALGADIPYFFEGGTALGVERGDVVRPMADVRRAWVVLAVPSFGVSTNEAFAWWDEEQGRGRSAAPADVAWINDLQRPVVRRYPEIGRMIRALRRLGATHAAMTGSGSTVFGLFSRQGVALDAAAALFGRRCRVLVTRTIDRRRYRAALAAK